MIEVEFEYTMAGQLVRTMPRVIPGVPRVGDTVIVEPHLPAQKVRMVQWDVYEGTVIVFLDRLWKDES
jgi:hypothetical protein